MIKKLFTLLTLALLAMPLAWGDDFYLVGNFNMNGDNWVTDGVNYKFSVDASASDEVDMAYTLTVQIPDWVTSNNQAYFQIYKGGTAWGPVDGAPWNIDHTHNGYSGGMIFTTETDLKTGSRFILQSPGTTTFSFKYKVNPNSEDDPWDLHVYREPKLSLRGNWNDWNNWNEEPMTPTSTGWTISKTNSQWREFGFVDEFGQWRGGPSSTAITNLVGTDLGTSFELLKGSKQFKINTDQISDIIINVNSDLSQTVIYSNTPESKSLADIEKNVDGGVVGKPYTISNNLQVVHFDSNKGFAIARDYAFNPEDDEEEINTSIAPVTCPSLDNQGGANDPIDFMRKVAVGNSEDHQNGEWKQNNWVMLDFSGVTGNLPEGLNNNGVIITGGTLKGVYTDNNNYTIKVANANFSTTTGFTYEPNVYSPANFYGDHKQTVQIGDKSVTYWFMTPKPMEYCKFTWAMYYKGTYGGVTYPEGFYMRNSDQGDQAALKGGVGLDMEYNSASPVLVNGESYRFTGVIMKTGQTSGGKANPSDYHPQDPAFNAGYKVAATDLTKAQGQVITGVSEVKTGSDVVSVTYCDLAGRMSQKPFAGVNIIVTRYSDGTVKTTKAIK